MCAMGDIFPVLLFDGMCNLCNSSVQWVLKRDTAGTFHFAALQSDVGRALLDSHGLSGQFFDSVVLVDEKRAYTHSDAVLELLRRLGGLWAILGALRVVPKPFRDGVYNVIARNRYRWFGRRDQCILPEHGWMSRFL
jgi:predicted DCC family thiol-disulfide oxidoreductase YuxK